MKKKDELLLKAAALGDTEAIKHCLSLAECDPLSKDQNGWSALMWAAYNGREECLKVLMPHSDSLALNYSGRSALILAACNGYETCVRLLLPMSDPLGKDKAGCTALMWAAWRGREA